MLKNVTKIRTNKGNSKDTRNLRNSMVCTTMLSMLLACSFQVPTFAQTVNQPNTNIIRQVLNQSIDSKLYSEYFEGNSEIPHTALPTNTYKVESLENNNEIQEIITNFENGDALFQVKISQNSSQSETNKTIEKSIKLDGEFIEVFYWDKNSNSLTKSANIDNLKNASNTFVYIVTTQSHYIFSNPTNYTNIDNMIQLQENSSNANDISSALNFKMSEKNSNCSVNLKLSQEENIISEYWYMSMPVTESIDYDNITASLNRIYKTGLMINSLILQDGYYMLSPDNFKVSAFSEVKGKNIFYKTLPTETLENLIINATSNFENNLAYSLAEKSSTSQDLLGNWITPATSKWLYYDYNIQNNYIDIKKNSEMALNLIDAYKKYGTSEFLKSAITYGEYLLQYSEIRSHKSTNNGILLEDFSSIEHDKSTFVSLDQQAVSINFLYELYYITSQEKFLNLANQLLQGIQDTKNLWIDENNNLKYFIYAVENSNLLNEYADLSFDNLEKLIKSADYYSTYISSYPNYSIYLEKIIAEQAEALSDTFKSEIGIVAGDTKTILSSTIGNTSFLNDFLNASNYNIKDTSNMMSYSIAKLEPIYSEGDIFPINSEYTSYTENKKTSTIKTIFENGDEYYMNRIIFNEDKDSNYNISIPIIGDNIVVNYIDLETKEWINVECTPENLKNNLPKTTLFIDTDTHSYVFGVSGVYSNDTTNNTLSILKDKEIASTITQNGDNYNFNISFPQEKDIICEYWYTASDKELINWNSDYVLDSLIVHDLSINRRWSYEGYYFPTSYNYIPGGENVIYKQPSNYTGTSFIRYGFYNFAYNFGYFSTEACRKNQNELGYWETGPESAWLREDFNIGNGFYDTRFNTDFGVNLLYAYKRYGKSEFLYDLYEYLDYFIDFANNNSYPTTNGGILVEDYGHALPNERTHVSLNHHLAEMNLLYEVYELTGVEKYLDLANKMLKGVEDTKDQWILDDGNLKYALYYTKNTNVMVDYPYLTYNDLHSTRTILKRLFDQHNSTINYLMESKLEWMIANNVTGYNEYIETSRLIQLN